MKRKRKPDTPQPIVFFRPSWMYAPYKRCPPRSNSRRVLFRQYLSRLPMKPPSDIKEQLQKTIIEMKGEKS